MSGRADALPRITDRRQRRPRRCLACGKVFPTVAEIRTCRGCVARQRAEALRTGAVEAAVLVVRVAVTDALPDA